MTNRRSALLAAVLVASAPVPALAQAPYDPGEPPPLPELSESDWRTWDYEPVFDQPQPEQPGAWDSQAPGPEIRPPLNSATPYTADGYDQRVAWLDECRARLGGDDGGCEAYLSDYERAYAAAALNRGNGTAKPGSRYVDGYPGPVMWVRVPIMRERRSRDCER